MSEYQLLSPNLGNSYELIDCGGFEKLERFGEYILARPEPQAVWDKSLSDEVWQRKAHATFNKTKGRDQLSPEERGLWQNLKKMPDKWTLDYLQGKQKYTFKLSLSAFKHVGIFPEQASNWQFIESQLQRIPEAKVLNLFAYTGGASLVAKAAGADVTHVDSVKPVITWARENMELSQLTDIRWIVEDALKFVQREVKRGKKYQGIILDPPAYGRGPNGEKWVLEEGINELMKSCLALLDEKQHFFIVNLYSMGFSALIVESLVNKIYGKAENQEMGELYLKDSFDKKLPLGVFYRMYK